MTNPAGYDFNRPDQIDVTDELLVKSAKRGSRAIKILVSSLIVTTIALAVAVSLLVYNNYGETARIHTVVTQAIAQEEQKTQKLCNFFGLLAPLPLQNNSSKVGVGIVVDSRNAYRGLGCTNPLPLPSTQLINLAHKYNIKITD